MPNPLKKHIFKNNHYSGSFLDPENRWCISAQFEKFEQIWGSVTYYYMYPTCKNSKKMHACEAAGVAKLG